ncbi:site-2 protease family protein [Demequina sp. SYSU T00192]|uniref:Site-2 protease family protein n=1 Tax=Demequina litoralis TaxID=3051660 RepID=A0ABT8G977_9MICO|nr:site-2 protease family protein [Demequina sp. SYSU T00192]MDN4475688.1 site-2 protease family protein [Demequina sp. SYSU T00192]
MAEVIGWVVLLVGLLVSIALHELGHMVPAKRFGVRVSEYFVGFGPTLWSRRGKETEYGVKAIPLGGYVKLVGMIPPAEAVKPVKGTGRVAQLIADTREASVEEIQPGEDARAFYHLTWWRKAIVMFGGPFVNLVIAVLLFTGILFLVGTPGHPTLTVSQVTACVPAAGAVDCAEGDPASPASQAGLEAGDTVTAVDGTPVSDWETFTDYVADRPGEEVVLTVQRDGGTVDVPLTPALRERAVYDDSGAVVTDADGAVVTEEVGYMGIAPTTETQRQGIGAGVEYTGYVLGATADVIWHLPENVYHVARASVGLEERTTDSVMGLVGVGRVAGEISSAEVQGYSIGDKVVDMLMLLGSLNLALFAFNMIPLVPLDGGHIVSAFWQGIKNGWARVRGLPRPAPVDVARMMPLAYGVFALLLAMGVILIYADIVAPVSVV